MLELLKEGIFRREAIGLFHAAIASCFIRMGLCKRLMRFSGSDGPKRGKKTWPI